MNKVKEYDWLMRSSQIEEVKIHEDGEGMGQKISEWLGTPEGSIADLPGWGNNLFALKQEPTSINLQVMAEMSIFQKMLVDIPAIELRSVGVEFPDIDMVKITIESNAGIFKTVVAL